MSNSFPFLYVGGLTNRAFIDEHGQYHAEGKGTVFNDLVVPLTTSKQGANAKPDYDFTNNGFLFPQNNNTEILYLIVQLPHSWKEGTTLYPHVHYQQSANTAVTFKADYKWFNVNAAVPAAWTTITMGTNVFSYVSGNLHQMAEGDTIAGTGKTISSILLVKLYRQDNTTTGDVLTFQFDIHYEADTLGSAEKYEKVSTTA